MIVGCDINWQVRENRDWVNVNMRCEVSCKKRIRPDTVTTSPAEKGGYSSLKKGGECVISASQSPPMVVGRRPTTGVPVDRPRAYGLRIKTKAE
ncbi:hypothetical protein CJD36_006310 [Flavipsychrobacter stenotrophus]|uniref:Uncharacterized protein n=1 Tax=Flavipsychrobacter stenotrophus TaxID=2077091 RepID=A0A2S7SWV9_9BACT|nr:hypothetical protein CJD36_006310 [Flavipsychrobacter stenotrophus]